MSVRVRFAPSPTGGLHIGGVRTALFNYLFAKKNKGSFVLRIEDTDQSRFVEGAEQYIVDSLKWCGLEPDESTDNPGDYGPYRQSERRDIYEQYAEKLLKEENAYYAFDTPEELEQMRERLKEAGVANLNYNSASRMTMKNSLTLSKEEVQAKIESGQPYVVRLKVPAKEEIRLYDEIRGYVVVHSSTLDDKVILKSDGLPTYHLANVVDDYQMKISHVIRGEEWLPSTPLHVLLYRFLGWEDAMPKFAHLPLILKADGNGKLSKRAADKAGIPIFPLSWTDPKTGEINKGFKETGFISQALVNFLAFLGWNPGTDKEIYSMEELVRDFSIERIGKAGTKFDYEKAIWFNQQYLKNVPSKEIAKDIQSALENEGKKISLIDSEVIAEMYKPRVNFSGQIVEEARSLFLRPVTYDEKVVRKKWNQEVADFLVQFAERLQSAGTEKSDQIQEEFQKLAKEKEQSPGKFMQPLRVSLTGMASGADLMKIIEVLGPKEVSERIKMAVTSLK